MKKQGLVVFCLLIASIILGQKSKTEASLSKSDNIKLDFSILAENKKKLAVKDASLTHAYQQLIKEADKLLDYKPVSVMQKTATPPSGNKHDYMSIGPYWWPDPTKPNGLPYIRKDGEVNPEVHDYPDKENMPKLCEYVQTLSLAYFYSNNEKYAQHASKLLEVWFLDSTSKMNPNLNFGQAIKGKIDGRAEGIIDTRHFIFAIDGAELIKTSKYWTSTNEAKLKQWFAEFLNWLNTSEIGKDELNAKNNHGIWYDAQTLAMALYTGNTTMADEIVLRASNRLNKQMNEDGFFPYELERNTSLNYSTFIMNAFVIIAQLSEQTNHNLWALKTKSGKTLSDAVNAILPYITKEKEWTLGKQIKPYSGKDAFAILLHSSRKLNCSTCKEKVIKQVVENPILVLY
jgi:hypothetical protein